MQIKHIYDDEQGVLKVIGKHESFTMLLLISRIIDKEKVAIYDLILFVHCPWCLLR